MNKPTSDEDDSFEQPSFVFIFRTILICFYGLIFTFFFHKLILDPYFRIFKDYYLGNPNHPASRF
jgi:hypothetical protein